MAYGTRKTGVLQEPEGRNGGIWPEFPQIFPSGPLAPWFPRKMKKAPIFCIFFGGIVWTHLTKYAQTDSIE
jgi:hypothetical protein